MFEDPKLDLRNLIPICQVNMDVDPDIFSLKRTFYLEHLHNISGLGGQFHTVKEGNFGIDV